MRLIDADAAEKALWEFRATHRRVDEICAISGCVFEIRNIPTIDAVPVVRCKECTHRHDSEFCECRPEDFFCADGERRTTMKCETCFNKRPVVSENGIHYVCCLSSRKAIACMTGRDDKYIKNPMQKEAKSDAQSNL